MEKIKSRLNHSFFFFFFTSQVLSAGRKFMSQDHGVTLTFSLGLLGGTRWNRAHIHGRFAEANVVLSSEQSPSFFVFTEMRKGENHYTLYLFPLRMYHWALLCFYETQWSRQRGYRPVMIYDKPLLIIYYFIISSEKSVFRLVCVKRYEWNWSEIKEHLSTPTIV